MKVSISSICADSSMRMLSYLKPRLTSSPRFSAACVHVIAMICAITASVGMRTGFAYKAADPDPTFQLNPDPVTDRLF
jgi:hypothetical protein